MEAQTDNKNRTRQDVHEVLKFFGAAETSTAYMFERRGRLSFGEDCALDEDLLFEHAVEAGAVDVQHEDGACVVYTEPNELLAVSRKLEETLDIKIGGALVWKAKDDAKVELADKDSEEHLSKLITRLEEDPSVQEIYLNAD